MHKINDTHKFLVTKPVMKRPFGRCGYKWEHSIKTDLKRGFENVNCIHLVQKRVKWWALMSMVMNFQVP